ncbi:hypothetical protein ACHAXA_006499 [Cyclostephanos tholiformis]|uniref:Ubiquitin-like domain-containing protein n=1 Tax=Cyclostephanos tholiformis TaxID=382380 RepID=A0ABD3RZG6_9STRA
MGDDEAKPDGDSKPAEVSPAGDAAPMTIIVKDQTGELIYFKIKRNTKMQKVIDAYATRKNMRADALRFLFDGHRIKSEDTPKTLELEEKDMILCMLEQRGGSSRKRGFFWNSHVNID